MRAFDKINEAKYHLNKMIEYAENLVTKDNGKLDMNQINPFRYELNSFINASRSVTFTLQKDLKTIYGNDFEEWYKETRNRLQENDFAKALAEVRNVIQKEGNLFPRLSLEYVFNEKTKMFVEYDFSVKSKMGFAFNAKFEGFRFKYTYNLSDDRETENRKAEKALVEHFSAFMKENQFSKSTIKLLGITIEKDGFVFSIASFIEQCKLHLELMQDIVNSAECYFRTTTNELLNLS